MNTEDDNRRDSDNDTRREQLLSEIALLQQKLRRTNRQMAFSDVMADFPGLAPVLFRERDLRRTDLRGADLRGIDFTGSDLSGCEFAEAMIAGARFEQAKVARAALRAAADWKTYCDRWGSEFSSADENGWSAGLIRSPGERFSLSPLLPEMIILSQDLFKDPTVLETQEQHSLEAGCLLLAVRALTNHEMVLLTAPEREAEADDEFAARPGYAALSYCRQLTARARAFGLPQRTVVRLPSYRLLYSLTEFGASEPEGTGRDLATDLRISDLRLGRDGAEFAHPSDGGELVLYLSRGWRSRRAQPAGDRHARVRPIFLAGGLR